MEQSWNDQFDGLVAIKKVVKFYILNADRQLTNVHSIVKGAVTHKYMA